MRDPVTITVYRWAGRKWFFRIRSECAECDLAVAQVWGLVSAHPNWPVEIKIKSWLTFLWESLRHGGWHVPVVIVNGRRVSQGKTPERSALEAAVQCALVRRGIAAVDHPSSTPTARPSRA
jgi:hypothetical protein